MPEKKPYRELTPASLIGGVIVGILLNMGICYAGMQIGFTIVGSTVAAVVGFGILRGILRRGSILEVNIFQTVASSVNTVNAGVIFTVPVLFLLGNEQDIDYWALACATMAGSALGVILIIPLRKQIIEFERLRFPEGVATAMILKSPGAGIRKAQLLLAGIVVSATIATLAKIPLKTQYDKDGAVVVNSEGQPQKVPLIPSYFNLGKAVNAPAGVQLVFAVSLLSLGAGYLAGRPGLAILYGTLLNFWVLIPICLYLGWLPAGLSETFQDYTPWDFGSDDFRDHDLASKFAGEFRVDVSRHVGIGMILGGALAGIVIALPALKAALASLRPGVDGGAGGEQHDDVSIRTVGGGLIGGMILLLVATKLSGGGNITWGKSFVVMLAGGAWLWLAGLVVAQTTGRTDWSPLSGLALIAIAILMGILGPTNPHALIPAVTVGAAICVATSMCADMMADLKTGYLVGSRPRTQQIAQIATCWIGPGIALAMVILLWNAHAFGPDQAKTLYDRAAAAGPEALAAYTDRGGSQTELPAGTPALGAPQAGALKAAIEIVREGNVPLGKYVAGALAGFVVSVLVSPGLGVMVGLSMYLPFAYMIVFGLGCVLNIVVISTKGARFAEDKGVPIAAGLIVGDALVGVTDALYHVLGSMGS